MAAWGVLTLMERPASAGAGFAMAEPAWGAPVPALSFAEGLPKRLLEGLRIPEVTLGLEPKMPLGACPKLGGRACPVGWRACIELAAWLILGTVVLIELLGLGGLERFVVVAGWVGLAGAATLLGVLLTLGDWLGLGEAGRLAAGWLVRLPPSALLLLRSAKTGSANSGRNKASATPTRENFAFAILYLPVNMAGLLNYMQPFIP